MDDVTEMADDRIAELLRSVVDDESLYAAGRAHIRARFLDEFDRASVPRRASVVELDRHPVVKRPHRARVGVLAVASVLAVVGAFGLIVFGRVPVDGPVTSTPTTRAATTTTTTTVPPVASLEDLSSGTTLAAGWHEAPLAGGVRFELLEPLVLERLTDEQLTLELSAAGQAAVISIVDVEPGAFRTALAELVGREELRIDPAVYRSNSLRLELTSEGAARHGCVESVRCSIDELSIDVVTRGETYVTTAAFDDGGGVIVVEHFGGIPIDPDLGDLLGAPDLTLGLRDVAAAIVDTIEPVESTVASGE